MIIVAVLILIVLADISCEIRRAGTAIIDLRKQLTPPPTCDCNPNATMTIDFGDHSETFTLNH